MIPQQKPPMDVTGLLLVYPKFMVIILEDQEEYVPEIYKMRMASLLDDLLEDHPDLVPPLAEIWYFAEVSHLEGLMSVVEYIDRNDKPDQLPYPTGEPLSPSKIPTFFSFLQYYRSLRLKVNNNISCYPHINIDNLKAVSVENDEILSASPPRNGQLFRIMVNSIEHF
ncbi:unnamed protein product [Hydatigera taeniaeformis]|uniref:IFT81_CH domain-containing protein n=1 Tax=Hydatigena taeniaeformis TaxID=6205 RepID=A0A0R3X2A3_HYDTA|nr:unnamed protein product [Hydatigera taeniaeformis]